MKLVIFLKRTAKALAIKLLNLVGVEVMPLKDAPPELLEMLRKASEEAERARTRSQ